VICKKSFAFVVILLLFTNTACVCQLGGWLYFTVCLVLV